MAAISFKRPFKTAILAGAKTQTLRKASHIEPGQTVNAFCEWGQPPFARLRIVGRDEVGLHELDEADAEADGFASLQELREVLHDLYPGATSFVRLRFDVEPTSGT